MRLLREPAEQAAERPTLRRTLQKYPPAEKRVPPLLVSEAFTVIMMEKLRASGRERESVK